MCNEGTGAEFDRQKKKISWYCGDVRAVEASSRVVYKPVLVDL